MCALIETFTVPLIIWFIQYRKLSLKQAINFISNAWGEIGENTIKNCWGATKIMPETSEPDENELDNEFQDETTNVDDATKLLEDLLAETNPTVQELLDNIEEYIEIIDQPAVTEDW
ncbi:19218_t:CDS:2 [Dentiscutata erythropus]|uniref:19218_t:CDS:1 n=1 Tax=Dentiscutata erythropus TaxID=1348616 RepID=A0A9N8YYP0_9GLOM|nr:19218_t:CDS:2 [Dentiscutata erythropus]